MKRHYLYLLILFSPLALLAQDRTNSVSGFTLPQCIQYAMENAIPIKNAIIDQQVAKYKVRETTGIGLPQVNGSVGLVANQSLRRFFGRASVLNSFDPSPFLQGLGNDVVSTPQFFQLKNSGDAGVTITETISASYFVGLSAAQTYRELAYKNANQTKESVIEQVSKAYYAALINNERMKLFSSNIERVDSTLKNTQALNKNGFAEAIDVDRIQVSLNNLITERDNFVNLKEISLELLKFQMNYPMDQEIQIAGDITLISTSIDLNDYMKDFDYRNRTDYNVLDANRKLQVLTVKNTKAAGLPSLSFNANYGYYTQSDNFLGLFSTRSKFQPADNIGTDKWFSYSGYGATLNVPIFSGLQRTYRWEQEKLNLIKIDNNFRTLKTNADLQIKQSTLNYQNNLRTLESQKRNMDLAMKVAKVTRTKYEQGVGSNIEVVDAESSLKEAQVNYYNALYNVLVNQIDLEKAFGKLLTNSLQSSN
jgi:outer membrane protein